MTGMPNTYYSKPFSDYYSNLVSDVVIEIKAKQPRVQLPAPMSSEMRTFCKLVLRLLVFIARNVGRHVDPDAYYDLEDNALKWIK